MPIAFVETMRGTLKDGAGAARPVDFHVRASGGSGGHFELSGVVHAAPWAEETVATGTLVISALPASIAYDVCFRARDGKTLRLHGAKRPSLFAPVKSMTVLGVTLSDEAGLALAEGTMRFDLMDLPGFLASWLPVPSKARRQLEARRVAVARRELLG
ncbi:MAG: hypothetical protein AMXMBFR34_19720 [Myxococcaceae bacterium]